MSLKLKLLAISMFIVGGLAVTSAGHAQESKSPPQDSSTRSGNMQPGMMQGGGTSGDSQQMMDCSKMMQGGGMSGMNDDMKKQMAEHCQSMGRQPSTGQSNPSGTTPEQKDKR